MSFYPFLGAHNRDIAALYDMDWKAFDSFEDYLENFYFAGFCYKSKKKKLCTKKLLLSRVAKKRADSTILFSLQFSLFCTSFFQVDVRIFLIL